MIFSICPFLIFGIFSVIISIKDIMTLKLPLILIYTSLILLILFDVVFCREKLLLSFIGAFVNFAVFFCVRLITKKGLGLGDVQLSILTGYFSGFPILFFSNLIAALLGLCWFGVYYVKHKTVYQIKVPFAPFMVFGSLCSGVLVFFGISNSFFI